MKILRIALLALFAAPLLAQNNVPPPQIGLSGNIGCIGFPCVNSGTYNMTADADVTLAASSTATSAFYLKVTSSVPLTAPRNIFYPAGRFPVGVENATTGGQPLNICGPTGTCAQIPNSSVSYTGVWNDGTNFVSSRSSGGSTLYVQTAPSGSQTVVQPGGTTFGVTGDVNSLNLYVFGTDNTNVGGSLPSTASGAGNTAVGKYSLLNDTTGYGNTALGWGTLPYNTTGFDNTAIGHDALNTNISGDNNTAIGFHSFHTASGSDNVAVGYSTNPQSASDSNEIVVGASVTGNGSNTTTIGGSSTTDTYLAGITHSGGYIDTALTPGTSPICPNGTGGAFTTSGCVSGSGTVTSFSSGNLSPLFTTSVATSTTTPAQSFSLSNAAQNSVFAGPASGGAGAPSYQTAPTFSAANLTGLPISTGVSGLGSGVATALGNSAGAAGGFALYSSIPSTPISPANGGTGLNTSAATGVAQVNSGTWSVNTALANGTTATTQSPGDNSTKLATTAYVAAVVPTVPVGANPTATATGAAINGTAATFMRSDAAFAIGTLNQSTTGNAATATALAALPTPCSSGSAPTGILANGNSTGCTAYAPASSGSPGGATNSVQYNNSGAFGGITGGSTLAHTYTLSWMPSTNGTVPTPSLTDLGLSTAYFGRPSLQSTLQYGLYSFGDSNTSGAGYSPSYPSMIFAAYSPAGTGLTLQNKAVSGTDCGYGVNAMNVLMITDLAPTISGNPVVTAMIGTNDAQSLSAGTTHWTSLYQCEMGAEAYAAIPNSLKISATTLTQSGTWASDTTFTNFTGEKSTTNASTLSQSLIIPDGIFYVWYKVTANGSSGGTFTVTSDGGSALTDSITTNTTLTTSEIGSGGAGAYTSLSRFTVTPGTHTISVNVTSATGSGNDVTIYAIGYAPNAAQGYQGATPTIQSDITGPRIYVGGTMHYQNDPNDTVYIYGSGLAAANTIAMNGANILAGDGLPVVFVDVRNYVNPFIGMLSSAAQGCNASANPGFHVNNCGTDELAQAFEAAMNLAPLGIPSTPTINGQLIATAQMPTYTTGNYHKLLCAGAFSGYHGTCGINIAPSGPAMGIAYTSSQPYSGFSSTNISVYSVTNQAGFNFAYNNGDVTSYTGWSYPFAVDYQGNAVFAGSLRLGGAGNTVIGNSNNVYQSNSNTVITCSTSTCAIAPASTASNATVVTLSANVTTTTLAEPVNAGSGPYFYSICQDGTGGRTITAPVSSGSGYGVPFSNWPSFALAQAISPHECVSFTLTYGSNGTYYYYASNPTVWFNNVPNVQAGQYQNFAGVQLGSSQTLTGVQGTTGTSVAATTGSFTSGNLRKTDSSGNEVDAGVGIPSLTSGSVLFSNGSTIAQDNSNFFWDATNHRLSIGDTTATSMFNVGTANQFQVTSTGVSSAGAGSTDYSTASSAQVAHCLADGTGGGACGGQNANATQTTVSCSTAGTATFSEPFTGASYKKVIYSVSGCQGTVSYTFPVAFTTGTTQLSLAGGANTVTNTSITWGSISALTAIGVIEGW